MSDPVQEAREAVVRAYNVWFEDEGLPSRGAVRLNIPMLLQPLIETARAQGQQEERDRAMTRYGIAESIDPTGITPPMYYGPDGAWGGYLLDPYEWIDSLAAKERDRVAARFSNALERWAERHLGAESGYAAAMADLQELREAAAGLIEQIELEIGPCDGTENSRLWPTANDVRAALARLEGR